MLGTGISRHFTDLLLFLMVNRLDVIVSMKASTGNVFNIQITFIFHFDY